LNEQQQHYESFVIWFRKVDDQTKVGLGKWCSSWKTYQHTWSAIRYGLPTWWGSGSKLEWKVMEISTGIITACSKTNK
jgi:hypothetical protein